MTDAFKLIGQKPRPRILIMGAPPAGYQDVIAAWTPTFRYIDQWHTVNPAEWDTLISFNGGIGDPHLDVLAFGGESFGKIIANAWIERVSSSVSEVLAVPNGLSDTLKAAVDRTLVPTESKRTVHKRLTRRFQGGYSGGIDLGAEFESFLYDVTGSVLAGRFSHCDGAGAETWVLPEYAPLDVWLPLALAEWNERDPLRYPLRGAWRNRDDWQTQAQRELASQVDALRTKRDEKLAELDAAIMEAEAALAVASAEAESGARRLLVTQGDELVSAVADSLTLLGFDVENMDLVLPKGERREDLRVRHAATPEWVAVVEVRGYARSGAATVDVLRLQRFAHRFEKDEGHPPTAAWYVVNQFFEKDPSERPPVLASDQATVDLLTEEHGGLMIDTAELFKAVSRDHNVDEVAAALRSARGRFDAATLA